MSALHLEPRLPDPDGFYAAIAGAARDLDPAAAGRFDAALVILLANHIADPLVLGEAIALARASVLPTAPVPEPQA